MESYDVVFMGDTNHSDPAIKKGIAASLASYKAKGFTTLAVEINQSKQELMDRLTVDMDVEAFTRDVLKLKNYEAMAALLKEARYCSHEMLAHNVMHLIWIAARHDAEFLA